MPRRLKLDAVFKLITLDEAYNMWSSNEKLSQITNTNHTRRERDDEKSYSFDCSKFSGFCDWLKFKNYKIM